MELNACVYNAHASVSPNQTSPSLHTQKWSHATFPRRRCRRVGASVSISGLKPPSPACEPRSQMAMGAPPAAMLGLVFFFWCCGGRRAERCAPTWCLNVSSVIKRPAGFWLTFQTTPMRREKAVCSCVRGGEVMHSVKASVRVSKRGPSGALILPLTRR